MLAPQFGPEGAEGEPIGSNPLPEGAQVLVTNATPMFHA
jgi:hypothetical protein